MPVDRGPDVRRKAGGGVKPPYSRSSIPANSMQGRSPMMGPTICTPTGNPDFVRPIGATVEGRKATPGWPAQNAIVLGRRSPLTRIVRSFRRPMIVRKGGRAGRRTGGWMLAGRTAPSEAQVMALLVDRQPVPVRHRGRASLRRGSRRHSMRACTISSFCRSCAAIAGLSAARAALHRRDNCP